MERRITTKGLLGLLIGLSGATWLLAAPRVTPAPEAQAAPAVPAAPAEEIDVEQAVSFPYDI